jgi:hypothetical protein
MLRCTVVVLLAAIWLEPVRAPYFHQHIESYTLVMMDNSASMTIEDRYIESAERAKFDAMLDTLELDAERKTAMAAAERHRRQDVLRLLAGDVDGALLSGLSARNRVRILGFADNVRPIAELPARRAGPDADPLAEQQADADTQPSGPLDISIYGLYTDLGRAMRQALDDLGGAPLAGVVVLSDGQVNHGEPVEVLGDLARALDAPVYSIGVGDASAPRNVRVLEWTGPSDAFVGDPVELSARVEAVGLVGESLTVELYERPMDRGGSAEQRVDVRTVVVSADGTLEPIKFKREPTSAGRMQYAMRIVPHPDEPVQQDNNGELSTNIIENKLRVLLVSGGPGWTYRFLSRLLKRDKTVDVSCWLQSADRTAVRDGNTVIDHLPDTPQELFNYDVVILLDPNAREIPDDWPELLDRHVSRNGAGVVLSAARQHTPDFFRDPRTRDIVDMLPVVEEPDSELILNQVGYYQKLSAPVEVSPVALAHPAFGGEAEGAGGDVWRQVARVYWHYPVKHEKAAANVLMRHGHPRMRNSHGGHVLLATQFVGSGRSAFVGFDGTWRWRRYGEQFFNRFWVQMLRHVAEGRLTGGGGRGRIQTDSDRYRVGETVVLRARLTDARYRPLEAAEVFVELEDPQGLRREVVLQADAGRVGAFRGQFKPEDPGEWVARIRLASDGDEPEIELSHAVGVQPPDIEFRDTPLDTTSLRVLSKRSAGGRYLGLDEATMVSDMIPDRHESKVRRGTPEALWDNGWTLAALIVLLGLEWALRKRLQLL